MVSVTKLPQFRLKGCPRDNGDMYIDEDLGTVDYVCLQCGYRSFIGYSGPEARRREPQMQTYKGYKGDYRR